MEFKIECQFSKEDLLHDERRRPFWNINLNAEWNLRCFCVNLKPRVPYSMEVHRNSKFGEVFVSGMLQINESRKSKKCQRRKFSKLLRNGYSYTRLNILSLRSCKNSSDLCLISGQININERSGRLIFDFHINTKQLNCVRNAPNQFIRERQEKSKEKIQQTASKRIFLLSIKHSE